MNEDEIRERVRAALAEALLPHDLPKTVHPPLPGRQSEKLVEVAGALNDRCVVCNEIATQIRYSLSDAVVAFHQRCHDIWKEETMRPPEEGGAPASIGLRQPRQATTPDPPGRRSRTWSSSSPYGVDRRPAPGPAHPSP